MKTLFLLRHAKSSWSNPGLRDFDRPLNARGQKAAKKMGRFMAGEGLKPERVLSSSSKRTRQTFDLLEKGFGAPLRALFSDDLYHSGAQRMLNLVQNAPEEVEKLMLIGHNPGLHEAALALIGEADEWDIERLEFNLPTAALAEYRFEVDDWAGVEFGTGTLRRLVFPKDL